jgi:hypothetical protein
MLAGLPDDPIAGGPRVPEFRRSPEQEALIEALRGNGEVGQQLAQIYDGHLAAMAFQHPERFVMAAHLMREFVEAAPHVIRSGWTTFGRDKRRHLLTGIRTLEKAWKSHAVEKELDDDSCVALRAAASKFFGWLEKELPSRRQGPLEMVRNLRPGAPELPEYADHLFAADWQECQDFFERVSHHDLSPAEGEFRGKVAQVTAMLLARMQPRHVAAVSEIDRLIEEHE